MRAWPTCALEDVADVTYGTRVTKKRDAGTRYPVYGGGGATFAMDTFNRENCYIVSRFGMSEECVRYVDGQFFLNDSGLTVGTKRPDELHQRFLDTFLLARQPDIYALGRGTAQKNLNVEAFKKLAVPIPPLEEQKRIVAVLDQSFASLDRARGLADANLADAEELFASEIAKIISSPPEDWQRARLGQFAELISGQHIAASDYNTTGKGIGYLTGPSDFGAFNPVVSKWTEHPKRTAQSHDILITVKGSGVGSVNMMAETELAISRQLMAIRAKPTVRDFLYFVLEGSFDTFQNLANGAAIPGISRSDVLNFEVSVPPATQLPSVIDRLRRMKERGQSLAARYNSRISDLEELRQSLLQKAFAGELT